jgi:GNAT superfamily N-acetyltransferase
MSPDVLAQFDHDERYAAVFPGLRREVAGSVVRHVDQVGHSGVVIHARLSAETADAAIEEQITYFAQQGQDFEWKFFQHDSPADVPERLRSRGFHIDDPEAVLILDLATTAPVTRGDVGVRRIATAAELEEVATVKQQVYGRGADDLIARLAFELEHAPGYLVVYVARVDEKPAATAWIRFPEHSAFASLWGGSTLPERRNRGLYTALLAARLGEARRRGFRYVTVDAGAMSRPILQRRGFFQLTCATACTWDGSRTPHGQSTHIRESE